MAVATTPKQITAVEISSAAGVHPKQFRQWLRDEKRREDSPLKFHHQKGDDWLFSPEQALIVLMVFHIRHGRIDVARTFESLSKR